MKDGVIEVAVVVGYHTYEVKAFQDMFDSFPGVHCYMQHLEQFTSSTKEERESYDVVIFYTMCPDRPNDNGEWYRGKEEEAIGGLGETSQGVMVLHHSLLAFDKWPKWEELTGYEQNKYRDYEHDVLQQYHVCNTEHPIMKGISDFEMLDEIYESDDPDLKSGMEVLMTASGGRNMNSVAWTKTHGKSKIFCFQPGHDHAAFEHESFRKIIYQAIQWLAEK